MTDKDKLIETLQKVIVQQDRMIERLVFGPIIISGEPEVYGKSPLLHQLGLYNKKETLADRIKTYLGSPSPVCPDGKVSEYIATIAKDYFKDNPFELGFPETTGQVFRDYYRKHPEELGIVSIDKVLKVFDSSWNGWLGEYKESPLTIPSTVNSLLSFIRKRLEKLKEQS